MFGFRLYMARTVMFLFFPAIVTGSPDCSILASDTETGLPITRLENSHGWFVSSKSWVAFAKLYESHRDVANGLVIFDKAVQVNFKAVDHPASIWCEWAEMEFRHKNFKVALDLMRRATAEPSVEVKRRVAADGNKPVQIMLYKSLTHTRRKALVMGCLLIPLLKRMEQLRCQRIGCEANRRRQLGRFMYFSRFRMVTMIR